jgi:Spy/CpxP family protein refolding chaperone
MKSTKTLLIATLAAGAWLAGSSALLAQDAPSTPPAGGPPAGDHGPGMKGGHHDIAKELDLTDAQKPKFQEIMKGAMDKRKALREDTSLTSEEKKAKVKAIQEDTSTQMKALLTPEQFTKWQEMSKKMRGNRPPGGGAGGPPPAEKPQN